MSNARHWIVEHLGTKCVICGETDSLVLHVDHKYGQGYLEAEYFQDKEDMFKYYVINWDSESKYLQVLCMNCNIKKRKENNETSGRPKLKELEKFLLKPVVDYSKWTKEQWDEDKRRREENEIKFKQFLKDNPQFVPIHERIKSLFNYATDFLDEYDTGIFAVARGLNWLPKPYSEILERESKKFSGIYEDIRKEKNEKYPKIHPEDERASAFKED